MANRPRGTVAFLFTDIEGSTRLWERDAAAMERALARHNEILDAAITAQGGVHFKTIGDAFQAAFRDPGAALAAAVDAQRALAAEPWPETGPIRVRMGLHVGEAEPDAAGDYLAPCLNRLSRLLAAGYGGQVLVSDAVQQRVHHRLPAGARLRDLGRHRLRDLLEPEHLAQLVITGLPDSFPPLKSLEGYPTNLPVLPTALIAREAELAQVALHLNSEYRLLTLSGPGGVGKTHLALQAAADALTQFEDGVWLVSCGELTDADLLLPQIAATLGVREGGGLDLREALFGYLANKRILIVLDNVEQLVSAAPMVAELLGRCSQVRLLVTSRHRLGIAGEQVFPINPLPLPDLRAALEVTAGSPAVQLFIERARAQDVLFRLDAGNASDVAHICFRLDGLPLAIELAAAQISHFTASELLRELEDRFGVLTRGRRDALSHQQTLEATFAWTYDRLTPEEQRTFRALSVFAGGWDQAAAIAVTEVDDGLSSEPETVAVLVESSLVRRVSLATDESRWSMLESLREFGRMRLETANEGDAVRDRFAAWCLQFVTTVMGELNTADQVTALERLEREHDNARAVLRWSGETGQSERQLTLASALAAFWQVRGYLSEGRRWLETALATAEDDATARLPAMVDAGILAQVQGDNEAAARWFERALAAARTVGDAGREAALLNNLGAVALWRGQIEEAERLFTQGLTAAEAIGDRRRRADALANLGAVAHYHGNVSVALAHYMDCIALWRELNDATGVADMLLNVVQLLAPLDKHRARAKATGEEALQRYRDLRNPQGEALALSSLGLIASRERDLDRAAKLHAESLTLFHEIEDSAGEVRALGSLGLVALDQGDLAAAAGHLERSLRLVVESGDLEPAAYWLEGLAAVRLAQGDRHRAAQLYGAADALWERIGIPRPPEILDRFELNRTVLVERMDHEFDRAWAAGREMSFDAAVAEALAQTASRDIDEEPDVALRALDDLLGLARAHESAR
jgi:predicted ATPase/class 3 adenylate cyclase